MLTESLSSLDSIDSLPLSPSPAPADCLIDRLFSEEALQMVDQLAHRLPYGSEINSYIDHLTLSTFSILREIQLKLPHFSEWSPLRRELSERAVEMVHRIPGWTAEMERVVQSRVAESIAAYQTFRPTMQLQESDATAQLATLERWSDSLESELGPQLGEMAVDHFLYGTSYPLHPTLGIDLWFKSGQLFMKALFDESLFHWIRDLPRLNYELNCWARCDLFWGWIRDGIDATGDSGLFSDPACWNRVRCAIDLPEWRSWIDFLEIAIQRHPHWFF